MFISIKCECGKQLRAKEEIAGKRIKCPSCGKVLLVPGPPAQTAPGQGPQPPSKVTPTSPRDSAPPAVERLATVAGASANMTPAPPLCGGLPQRTPRHIWPWLAAGAGCLVVGILVAVVVGLRGRGANPLPGATGPLPGATGPRLVELAQPPDPIKIKGIYLTTDPTGRGSLEEWNQVLPSGTKDVYVGVVFPWRPPVGTQVSVEVESEAGLVQRTQTLKVPYGKSGGPFTLILPLSPTSGAFPDGRYQTKVLVNQTALALLNWSIGPP